MIGEWPRSGQSGGPDADINAERPDPVKSCLRCRLYSVDCFWQKQSLSLRSANVSHQSILLKNSLRRLERMLSGVLDPLPALRSPLLARSTRSVSADAAARHGSIEFFNTISLKRSFTDAASGLKESTSAVAA